jgi:starch-binding outer membrane protein, SusD/RagB family
MRMKIFSKPLLTSLVILTSFTACDVNKLDTPPVELTEDSYLTLETEYDQLLYNAYAKMTDWYWFAAQDYKHAMYFLPGDDITEPNGAYVTWESFNNLNSNDPWVSDFFRATYELIQRANVIIEKTSTADRTIFEDPSFLDQQQGEGYFLRALAFFKLYNMYGTAPIVLKRLDIETLHQPRSTGTQLLDQAIADLQMAIPLLPEAWPETDRGRATKNSANGLLMKSLVFRGDYTGNVADYTAAVAAFGNITAQLIADYTENFSAFAENNAESIFEFQASAAPNQDNVWLFNDGPWRGVEVMSTYWGFYSIVNGPQLWNRRGEQWRVTEKMFNLYGTDPRIDYFTEDNRGFTKYGKEGLDEVSPGGFIPGSMNNVRIMRYADLKLLAAEALLLSGGSTSEAIGHINDVRARASAWATTAGYSDVSMLAPRNTGETDQDVIMGWIEDERAIELLGEEQIRWFDLKRWDARGYISLEGWDGTEEHFSTDLSSNFGFEYPKHLLLPIPQSEINRNNAINENNPGY